MRPSVSMCSCALFYSYFIIFRSNTFVCYQGCDYFFVIMGMQFLDIFICQAAENGKVDCMQALLEAGADKEAKSQTGQTALMCVSTHKE